MQKQIKNFKPKKVVENKETPNYFNVVIEILFLFFMFTMPIIFDRRIGIVFSLTKTTFMYIMMIVILSLWSIKILISGQTRWVHSALGWPIVSYMLSVTVATITSVHVYTSLVGFYGRYEGLFTLYTYGLCAFIVINYFTEYAQLKRLVGVIAISSTIMGVYGMIQRLGIDPYAWGGVVTWLRVIATIGQPNFLAGYVDMTFMLILFLLLIEKPLPSAEKLRDWKNYWLDQLMIMAYFFIPIVLFVFMIYTLGIDTPFIWYLGFLLMGISGLLFAFNLERLHPYLQDSIYLLNLVMTYICLLNTISRGGYLGFLVAIVLFGVFVGRRVIFKEWKKILLVTLVIGLLSAVYFFNPSYSPIRRFSEEIKTGKIEQVQKEETVKKTSAEEGDAQKIELAGAAGSRGETWKSAFHIISDRPLFGIGPEVLKMVFPRYETELFRFRETFHVKQDRCHNSIFDVNVTRGMVSFIIYIWLLFTVFKLGICWLLKSKGSSPERIFIAAALAGIISYKIQNQFSFGVVAIGSLYWVLMGTVVSLTKAEPVPQEKPVALKMENIPWLPVALVVVVAVPLLYFSTLPFQGDLYYKTGLVLAERQQFEAAVAEYEKSLRVFPYEGVARTRYGIAYLNLMQQQGLSPQKLQKVIDLFNYAAVVDPYNADNFHILGKIYLIEDQMQVPGALDTSIQYSEKALKIDPYYAEVYENLGVAYERRGQLDLALKMYEKAFMVNPYLSAPMERFMILAERTGQAAGAEKVLEAAAKKYFQFIPVHQTLAEFYMKRGNLSSAIQELNRIFELEGENKNIPARLKLAEIYFRLNRFKEAQDYLSQVVFIDPKNIDAHNGLGAIYLRTGDKEKAKQEFEQVLMLDPNNAYAKRLAGGIK